MAETTTLVERLRLNAEKSPGYFGILGEAADTIERQEQEIERLRQAVAVSAGFSSWAAYVDRPRVVWTGTDPYEGGEP